MVIYFFLFSLLLNDDIKHILRDSIECTNAGLNPPKSVIAPWKWT